MRNRAILSLKRLYSLFIVIVLGGVAGVICPLVAQDELPGLPPPAIPDPVPAKPRTAFTALPRGVPQFDGVTFRISRPVNIIGTRAAKAGGKEFARINDPTIRGRGKYIYVLHTGDHGSSPMSNYIWRLVLNYADGQRRHFDFAYGVHIRNFWRHTNVVENAPIDPDSSIVWTGTSVESDRRGADLVVSRTTLTNDRPNVDVISADFVSLLGQSSAYVFAVTLSDQGPKPIATRLPSLTNVPPLTFVFEDAAGKPRPGIILNCVFECDGFAVRLAPAPADRFGQVTVDVPTAQVSVLSYEARGRSGHVEAGRIEINPGDSGWRPHVLRFAE
jgi:hypothetical protein